MHNGEWVMENGWSRIGNYNYGEVLLLDKIKSPTVGFW